MVRSEGLCHPERRRLDSRVDDARYKFTRKERIFIESKEDMKKRGVRSPDLADAFMMTFASDAIGLAFGGAPSNWKQKLSQPMKGLV